MAAMASVEEDLAFIENALRALRHEYDLFFAGSSKVPPAKLRGEADRRARALGTARIEQYSLRYKLQSMLTRYGTQAALWDKQMRLRESGIRDPRSPNQIRQGMKELHDMDVGGPDALAARKASETPAAAPAAPGKAAPEDPVFAEYARLKQQTGEKLGTDAAKFASMLEKKKAELAAKGMANVTFVPAIKDGKVILKARAGSG